MGVRFRSHLKPISEMGMEESQKAGKWGFMSLFRAPVGVRGAKPPEAEMLI